MIDISDIKKNRVPEHVAIIMDGNGRWAEKNGKERIFGHQHGVDSVRDVVEAAGELGVRFLTLYAFSTENWNRPQNEINALMELLVHSINNETDNLIENGVKLHVIGDIESLPQSVRTKLDQAIAKTDQCSRLNLILALSYSGRWEICHAIRKIADKVKNNQLDVSEINADTISECLTTSRFPDPELLIRTSGEYRVSNFLLWQIAYTEFYFTSLFWPDFRKEEFYKAIIDFQHRERRFGKTSSQISKKK